MKIKNRQDLLVVVTVVAVVLYITVSFIFPPIINWWGDRQKQITSLRDKVKAGNGMIKQEKTIRGNWAQMRDNALPADLPQAEQQFLKAVDGWSRASSAEITSIMPQWKADATNYMTLDCRVETTGDLNALSKFIYAIEQGPMMVRLDSVELSSHDLNGQQMTLGLEINGLALLQNDKK